MAIAASLLILLGAVATQVIPEDSASRSTLSDALYRYREAAKRADGPGGHPRAELPPLGVYRYRTDGAEEIETTAFTASHSYDGVSMLTLTPNPCGVTERWQPLRERWSEGRLCAGAETNRVVAVRDFHQFFSESRLVSYSCTGDRVAYARALRPGDRWETRCRSDQGEVISRVKVTGIGRIQVAGETIKAVRLHSTAQLEGDPDGSDDRHSWIRRSDGLLLRRINRSTAEVDVTGGGTFREEYELKLISTEPLR